MASSFHGAVRSTMDVDLVCELNKEQIPPFIESLGGDYYVSAPAVQEAVERKSCFNLIHLTTSFKVDIFVSRNRPFDLNSMQRARLEQIADDPSLSVLIASAEDSIIAKLEWYQIGNRTSERQWDDVSRLIKLLGEQADVEYLNQAAASVGVSDLLRQLLEQA